MKRVFVFFIFCLSLYFTYSTITYKTIEVEPDIDHLLKTKVTKDYLEKKITEAIKEKKFNDAKSFLYLADYLHITLTKQYNDKIEQQDTLFFKAKEFTKGFINGKTDTAKQLYGSIASDFTVVGDLRDIKNEGLKYIKNQPYDEFLLGISIAGVTLALTPLKIGTTILKTAKRANTLTKNFTRYLTKSFSKTYDKKSFININFQNINSIKLAINTVNITPILKILKSLIKIEQSTSFSDTIFILKYIDTGKDLTKVTKISQKYKKNTKAIFKVLGKSAIKTTKKVFVYTYEFLASLFSTLFSLLLIIIISTKKV